MVRRPRAPLAGTTAFAVLTEANAPIPDDFKCDEGGPATFLGSVLEALGELGTFGVLEITDHGEPRLTLHTSQDRRYALTLPASDGPFELWATVEMSSDDGNRRYEQLREREEVLAQALHAPRLAWHLNGDVGWIGLPVALAFDAGELDTDLAQQAAEQIRMLVFTVERICRALDERAEARLRRRRDRSYTAAVTTAAARPRRAVRGTP